MAPPRYDPSSDNPVHIFWTGGWDSTFRVCQLIIEIGARVQPIYVHSLRESGGQRLCVTHEIQAIEYMQADLRHDFPSAAARLEPLILISQAEIYGLPNSDDPPPFKTRGPGLSDGWQYSVLGAIAARWNQSIELSIERSSDGHNLVGDSLIPHVVPTGNSYQLRDDLPQVLFQPNHLGSLYNFRHLLFPLLFTSRSEMCEIARNAGYLHILEESWSCTRYRPDNTQCGECFCCRGRIRDGVWKANPFERWLSESS